MQHVFDRRCIDSGGSDLYRDAARAEGFGFEAIVLQFVRDFGERGLLRGRQLEHDRHEEALAFYFLHRALLEDALEQYALVRDMLIDNPQAIFVYRKDERIANLSERPQRSQR